MIAGLQAGKYDVAAAINRRPARAPVVTFSTPYMADIGTFAMNRDKVKAKSWAELDKKGTKIAVVMGTAEDKALTRIVKAAELVRLPDQNEAMAAVRPGGRILRRHLGERQAGQGEQGVPAGHPDPAIEVGDRVRHPQGLPE
jgi:hypothetical protein